MAGLIRGPPAGVAERVGGGPAARRRGVLLAVAALSACATVALLSGGADVALPLGPDGGMWGMAARVWAAGGGLGIPPLFPALVALGGAEDVVGDALLVNAAAVGSAGATVGVVAARVARTSATRAVAAVGGCALALVGAHLWAFAWYVQPDALAGAVLAAVGLAGLEALRRPTALRLLAWGGAAGLAVAAREHGLVVAALAPIGAALLPGTPGTRATRALLVLLGEQGAWGLVTGRWLVPYFLDGAAFDKAANVLSESLQLTRGALPAGQAPPDMPAEVRESAGGLRFLGYMLARAWTVSGPERALLLGGALGVGMLAFHGRRREAFALGLPLLTVLPASVVWTQWRHFLVPGPAAAAALVAGVVATAEARWPRPQRVVLAFVGVLTALGAHWTAGQVGALRGRVDAATEALAPAAQVAAWLRENAPPGSLYSGDARIGVMAGLPPSPVMPGTPPIPDTWPHPAWRTWIAAERGIRVEGPWQAVHRVGRWTVYRAFPPPGVPTACLFGRIEGPLGDGYPAHDRTFAMRPAEGCEGIEAEALSADNGP